MMETMIEGRPAVVLNPKDSVGIALRDLKSGDTVHMIIGNAEFVIKLLNDIPFGHKFAVRDIPMCGLVVKYSHVIGRAKRDIKAGEHVHVHNVESLTSVHSACKGRLE